MTGFEPRTDLPTEPQLLPLHSPRMNHSPNTFFADENKYGSGELGPVTKWTSVRLSIGHCLPEATAYQRALHTTGHCLPEGTAYQRVLPTRGHCLPEGTA